MKIQDLDPIDRPREKLIKLGGERLKNSELLAILINTGIKGQSALEIGENILKKNTIEDFLDFDYSELVKIPGINEAKACKILAVKELLSRSKKTKNTALQITEPKLAASLLNHLKNQKKEHLEALYLNVHNELIWQENISIGLIDTSLIHPREVFEPAIRYLASGIILAHNHPTGDLQPSEADILSTKQVMEAGKILGIEILDHLIIGKNNFLSMKEEGFMEI